MIGGRLHRSGYGRLHRELEYVKIRDSYTCQKCYTKDGMIVSHHLVPWKENKAKRFDIENGLTLCQSCHAKLEGFQTGHPCMRKKVKT